MSKKIKVFLGGFVNYLAAQNINCRSLSEHMDKERFEVYTILYPYPNAEDFVEAPNVHYIRMNKHLRSLGWVAVVQGILKCDVIYWAKYEYCTLARITAKLLRKKYFRTVEGILADSDIKKVKNPPRYIYENKAVEPYLYPITRHIRERLEKERGFHFADEVLYLGVETSNFTPLKNYDSCTKKLNNVVFVGNNLINKGIDDFFKMSELFPEIEFHIVGTNVLWNGILEDYIKDNNHTNVHYQGRMNHTELSRFLRTMDIMYFPSRAEGFPKVQLEAACAGVPTICYADYGADEWITTGEDGYVVHTFEEAAQVVRELTEEPEKLIALSKNAVKLGQRFDWAVLVKTWEREIEKIYNQR